MRQYFYMFTHLFNFILVCRVSFAMTANVLQLQEVGDSEALNCLPPQNLIPSTKLHLTTEPPIFCRCCYKLVFFRSWPVCSLFTVSWLGGSFGFFLRWSWRWKKYKCATKYVGYDRFIFPFIVSAKCLTNSGAYSPICVCISLATCLAIAPFC